MNLRLSNKEFKATKSSYYANICMQLEIKNRKFKVEITCEQNIYWIFQSRCSFVKLMQKCESVI